MLQFGRHLEKDPAKVVRVLKMMESIARDRDLYFEARFGQKGTHWEFDEIEGIQTLPPYKGNSRLSSAELLGSSIFFFPCSLEQIYDEVYMAAVERDWYHDNRRTEWGMMNVLGKSDVVPTSGRYLADLVNFQMTMFVEIVVGERGLDAFDDFVAEWNERGGRIILEEANAMYSEVRRIYNLVGVQEADL